MDPITAKKVRELYQKYEVKRNDGKSVQWAFVLEDKDPLAIPALEAYAAAARQAGYNPLADDLEAKVQELRQALEQPGQEQP